jgi:hypothetical protein
VKRLDEASYLLLQTQSAVEDSAVVVVAAAADVVVAAVVTEVEACLAMLSLLRQKRQH